MDLDFSFAFWNTDFLFTVRALEKAIVFSLTGMILFSLEKACDVVFDLQIFFVFCIPFISIPGKHPEIAVNQKHHGQQIKQAATGEHGENHEDEGSDQHESGKFIGAISSGHKLLKSVS